MCLCVCVCVGVGLDWKIGRQAKIDYLVGSKGSGFGAVVKMLFRGTVL